MLAPCVNARATQIASIDWSSPWLAPMARWRHVLCADDVRAALSKIAQSRDLITGYGQPLQFADEDDADATPYELHIARTGRVPTRTNWHDLFNAAAWLTYPRTKAALNARQAQVLEQGAGPRRGAVRDVATLFDESGLILAVAGSPADGAEVRSWLVDHAWPTLFIEHRAHWQRIWVPWLFGHAVMEKLARPYAGVVGRVWVVALDAHDVMEASAVDAATAEQLKSADLSPVRVPPLPVLGIPGWWSANERNDFYDNTTVFRPARVA